MADSSSSAADNARLLSQQALGAGKSTGEDPGGTDNALGTMIVDALNRLGSMVGKAGIPGMSVANSVLSTGAQVGFESPQGFAGATIMKAPNVSGGDGALYKIFAALKKGGTSIKDLTEGISGGQPIEALQPMDVSYAMLGTLSSPITPNTGGTGMGMEI